MIVSEVESSLEILPVMVLLVAEGELDLGVGSLRVLDIPDDVDHARLEHSHGSDKEGVDERMVR